MIRVELSGLVALGIALLAGACGGDAPGPGPAPIEPVVEELPGIVVEAEPQRLGDAQAGYTALVNNGYVSCGLPYSVYQTFFQAAPEHLRLPGRTGNNETLPYYYTAFETPTGVDVVAPNCLLCHAAVFEGQLVIGLGAHDANFTVDQSVQAQAVGGLINDPDEKAEWQKWADRVVALSPYTQAPNRGVTPSDNIAAVLIAHRDRETLAWSNEPLLPLPPEHVVPVDVPPWWRMKQKNAMFYSAAGRGDHARIMMSASALCTDSVQEAEQIDSYFPDVRAYILSLEAPPFPAGVDAALAEEGRAVFETNCAQCHGKYGPDDEYPNRLIPYDEVGTDSVLAVAAAQLADVYVDWYNESFYGELGRLEPQEGYMAPPLNGIWATAPYFHNGSVPSLVAVLDSSLRPTYWKRDFAAGYDFNILGWPHQALDYGHDVATATERIDIYDTTLLAYGNGGHTFGDPLSAAARTALFEYLKTL